MRIWSAMGLLLLLAACGRCGKTEGSAVEPPALVRADESTPVGEVPLPRTIYKAAYDRARQEITADDAEDRLWELEQDVGDDHGGAP
jgi:hypothetical protein